MPNNVTFNINTQASVTLVNRLTQVHRAALPNAVRGTLNAAAFDVKTRTLDDSATQNFIRRAPTFFKRFSGVNKATGFELNSMRAEVGMTANGVSKAEPAIRHMYEQEHGGSIEDGLEYMAGSRIGRNPDRMVQKSKYALKKNVVHGRFKRAGTTKSRRVAAAYVALREGLQLKTKANGRNFYSMVTSIRKLNGKKNIGKVKINSRLLSASRTGHPARIKATHFAREAAERTQPRIEQFFVKEANRQLARYWK